MSTTHERLGASRCDDGVALKAIEPLRGEIWRTTMPRQIRPTRCVPALDWDLRGQDRGGTLVAIVDDLHQVATLLGGKPGHGPIVDYEQLYPGELGEQPGGLAVDAGEGEFVEKPGKPLIAHREPATRGLVADGASEETLAATGRARAECGSRHPRGRRPGAAWQGADVGRARHCRVRRPRDRPASPGARRS